jgi:GT2 family glycosyltransferase/glycosyltransferase involved in cell wall biosynthesis
VRLDSPVTDRAPNSGARQISHFHYEAAPPAASSVASHFTLVAALRRLLRRTRKVVVWAITGQLPSQILRRLNERSDQRLKARDNARTEQTPGQRYSEWVARYDTVNTPQRTRLLVEAQWLTYKPLISVVMPVYNVDPKWLNAAIDSICRQIYPKWELCLSDDASTLPGVRKVLEAAAKQDDRIKVTFRDSRGHISANTNSALTLASGEFVALVDADDELPEDALFWVAKEIAAHPQCDMLFSDEDKIDEVGNRFAPYFKSDWNPSLMLSQNAFCHLGVFRRTLLTQIGGLREGYEGAQDHDLALRCANATSPKRIRHIPRILYHWRVLPQSTAGGVDAKSYAWDAACRTISDHLARHDISGVVRRRATPEPHLAQYPEVVYSPPAEWPRVAVIIPTALKREETLRCIRSVLQKTTYPNVQLCLLVSKIDLPQARTLTDVIDDPRVSLIEHDCVPFNYSAVNNLATSRVSSEFICFLNDDIEVITADWLQQLVLRARLPGVGAAGAMLYYPNDTIQHAGVLLGFGGIADHAYRNHPRGSLGYLGRAAVDQDLSCVTAACAVVRREAFEKVGRFDETLPCAFNDVDLCLKLRRDGWRIIWTPAAEMYHVESLTFGHHASAERADQFQRDWAEMRTRWSVELDADPFYNPNLSLIAFFDLAFPPRTFTRASFV